MLFQKLCVVNKIFLFQSRKYCAKTFLKYSKPKPFQLRKKIDFDKSHYFSDSKIVHVLGGKGGDGCISFLQLWCNELAGPDGGDGGNGGHVIFKPSLEAINLNQLPSLIQANDGERGRSKDCHGKNAPHKFINVPIGTIIRDLNGKILCNLNVENGIFIAARGGGGGKGNRFFANSKQNTPKVCEYGSFGETITYSLELRCAVDICLIGCPNVGKSTLLRAISGGKPNIAPYFFSTLRPHIGVVTCNDHQKLTVADMPGLIAGSSKNRLLGIDILKHVERFMLLLFVIDVSQEAPWNQYNLLVNEITKYNPTLLKRQKLIVGNKIDIKGASSNIFELERRISNLVMPISAKNGLNISNLLFKIWQYNCLKQ